MAKSVSNDVLDAACAELATGTRVVVCSAEPANFAGIAAVALADVTVTAGSGNGAATVVDAAGDVTIDTSGTATHISVDDGSVLLAVTTCTSQALTSGGTVTIPATDFEFADPT